MDVTISLFTIDAYDEAIALWKQAEGIRLGNADSKENIQFYLERNPGMSFIAKDNGTIIGTVLSGHDGRRGYIHHLAVHPHWRRQGIGRKLVKNCLSALRTAGIQTCYIFIFKENLDGIRFWESIGWKKRSDISIISKDI